MKIISLTFFSTFLNETTSKDKTHMKILVLGLSQNLNKKWKEKWNWVQFSEKEKMFCVVCRKYQEKMKKIIGFTEA